MAPIALCIMSRATSKQGSSCSWDCKESGNSP
eukprot:CAMPEP_0173288504 /NCGR_PEP_ID=MMETSP1143-20121109/10444_1 /TAXON_ID=483371 /ORGANISM="non described non described, Strain CCMP2298" /LENGTH=31 /DNA_ID= /DNA_START= /DNA_END= /DNA_ORIENTATION=